VSTFQCVSLQVSLSLLLSIVRFIVRKGCSSIELLIHRPFFLDLFLVGRRFDSIIGGGGGWSTVDERTEGSEEDGGRRGDVLRDATAGPQDELETSDKCVDDDG
jgi:hypothetical protein